MATHPPPTTIIDFRHGEAAATLSIIILLSQHRELPIKAFGSVLVGRPTINVKRIAPIGDSDVRREYMGGRVITLRESRSHETEHFSFEWVAPIRDDEESL